MKNFIIQSRETGSAIEHYQTLEEAQKALKKFEEDDHKEGIYTSGFYEIVELRKNGLMNTRVTTTI